MADEAPVHYYTVGEEQWKTAETWPPAQVEARVGGNPMFVMQLFRSWVERGLLESGEIGLRLKAGVRVTLPDDLYELWSARICRILERRPAADGIALELAAVLGFQVSGPEWTHACRALGIAVPWSLVELLRQRGLARCAEPGWRRSWSFGHTMLRECLQRRACEAGRLVAHHQICAEMLTPRSGAGVAPRYRLFF